MPRENLYWEGDSHRQALPLNPNDDSWRSAWRRDYARVIHAPSFRRLQGKTQLFYGSEVDALRNRLTHSLEVAQIAKSIAQYINYKFEPFTNPKFSIEPDICEVAGLVHDMGHPPFGHNGEKALDDCALKNGGFEGNAQTLRIIAKLEKRRTLNEDDLFGIDKDGKDHRAGLNLTYRVLAASLKYDEVIPKTRSSKGVKKGYYHTETELIKRIKEKVLDTSKYKGKFKTIECNIMDIADDIAYSTYDLEDAFKAEFLNPLDLLRPSDAKVDKIWQGIDDKVKNSFKKEDIRVVLFNVLIDMFRPNQRQNVDGLDRRKLKDPDAFADYLVLMSTYTYRDAVDLASNGYRQNRFTSELVNHHIHDIEVEFNEEYPALSEARLKPNTRFMVEVLKKYAYVSIIESPQLKIPEYRGYGIVETLFNAIVDDEKEGYNLLPEDFRTLYLRARKQDQHIRLVVDFVSGMTDRYAIEFYNKLVSDVPQTIFSPL